MSNRINKRAYEKLIEEDIALLNEMMPASSLERQHIEQVLRWSINAQYPDKEKSVGFCQCAQPDRYLHPDGDICCRKCLMAVL